MISSPSPTAEDWQLAAASIAEAATTETIEELVSVTLSSLHRLFRANLVIWDLFDQHARQLDYRMHPPATEAIARLQPAFQELFCEHPFAPDLIEVVANGRVIFLSDRTSARDFRRTGLWNEVYIHLFAKHQMIFGGPLEADRYWIISVHRLSPEHNRRERELGRFLQAHLSRLFQRQAQRDGAARALGALSQGGSAFLVVDRAGRILDQSLPARELMRHATPNGNWQREIAALAAQPSAPGRFARRSFGTIEALALPATVAGPRLVLLASLANGHAKGSSDLTTREREIFHWLGEGKSNTEIGILLGISPRTVGKHCERLFAKLGVENRLGAAILAQRKG